jgi:hypothetical protein
LVAVWSYGDVVLDEAEANEALRHFAREVVGPYWPPERHLVDDGYRSIEMPFDEIDVPSFEMAEWWTVEQLVGYVSTWSATSLYRKAVNDDPTGDFEARLRDVWGNSAEARRVAWRLSVRVGRVS